MNTLLFIIIAFILIFIIVYRKNAGQNFYKYITTQTSFLYNKFAPYSFQVIREKVKELGQEYTSKQYAIQIAAFMGGSFLISYLYFYSILISLIYSGLSVFAVPYLTYLRCKRVYSEYIFEQIQVYTTNTIMEFSTTQSFVKALEGVVESGVLEDPVKSDVQTMIDMAYENGTVDQSIIFFNNKYNYFIVKNMHQLFLQITNEGARDSSQALENMSQDIDMLVESVYRDRMDRSQFHKKFLTFGFILYLMVMVVQLLLGQKKYIDLLSDSIIVKVLLHVIIIVNTYFLLNGEKYYNENVGAE